jgi:hypothetical protein
MRYAIATASVDISSCFSGLSPSFLSPLAAFESGKRL